MVDKIDKTIDYFIKSHKEKISLTKRIINDWNKVKVQNLKSDGLRLIHLIEEIIKHLEALFTSGQDLNKVILDNILFEMKKPIIYNLDEFNLTIRQNIVNLAKMLKQLLEMNSKQNEILTKHDTYEAKLVADIESNNRLHELLTAEQKLDIGLKQYLIVTIRNVKDFFNNLMEKKPLISVIIPAYNEEEFIKRALHSCARQTYPNKEVIVANNLSTDNTEGMVKPYTYYHIYLGKKGVSVARNAGGKLAHGKILVFLDADSMLGDNILQWVYEEIYLKNKVGGSAKVVSDKADWKSKNFWRMVELCKLITLAPAGIIWCAKESFKTIGGFREDLHVAEDVDFLKKLRALGRKQRKKLYEIKDAVVPTSSRRFEKRRFGYIRTFFGWGMSYLIPLERKKYEVVR